MRVENKICFYLNHTRDITMYSDFFSKLQNKNVCFIFNDLFKEKINNNANEFKRIKFFLNHYFPKYNKVYKLSEKLGKIKFKILISAGDIPTSSLTILSILKYIIKKIFFIENPEIYSRKHIEKYLSKISIRFPNNLDRNMKYFPDKNWENVFDIFFISFEKERSLIQKKFKKKKIFNIGFPRLDKKFKMSEIKNKIIKEFKLDKNKKIIFYLPTLSKQKREIVINYINQLSRLSKKYNVIIRPHPKDQDLHKEKFKLFKKSKIKLDLKNGRDTSHLILSSDLVISDGGSTIVEAIYLGRKILFHNWMKFENKKNLEKRFTEKERLDKIFSKRIDLVDNLDDFKKIDDLLNKKNSLLKIIKLRNTYFISNKKINPINLIKKIYDNKRI